MSRSYQGGITIILEFILTWLMRWSWRNPKRVVVASAIAVTFLYMTFQLIQTRTAEGHLQYDWNRDHGLLLCEQQNPREGLLFLLRAFEIATHKGDADRQRDAAKSLLAWRRGSPLMERYR